MNNNVVHYFPIISCCIWHSHHAYQYNNVTQKTSTRLSGFFTYACIGIKSKRVTQVTLSRILFSLFINTLFQTEQHSEDKLAK